MHCRTNRSQPCCTSERCGGLVIWQRTHCATRRGGGHLRPTPSGRNTAWGLQRQLKQQTSQRGAQRAGRIGAFAILAPGRIIEEWKRNVAGGVLRGAIGPSLWQPRSLSKLTPSGICARRRRRQGAASVALWSWSRFPGWCWAASSHFPSTALLSKLKDSSRSRLRAVNCWRNSRWTSRKPPQRS